ncbi:MAG: PIN domain-containing protein [Verrucomicrobiota bacterium]
MAVSPVLVDSSFYIREAREGRDPLKTLAPITATRDVAVCGVIRCEVGRGVKEPRVLDRYNAVWDVMIYVPTDNRLWDTVAKTLWHLDRRGINLSLPDVIIGCCAMRIGAIVLTHDGHFYDIPGVRATNRID